MKSVRDVILALGGTTVIARKLGLSRQLVHFWGNRNSIPAAYWEELVNLAGKSGVSLSPERLMRIHSRVPRSLVA
jgi:hypothetical protein